MENATCSCCCISRLTTSSLEFPWRMECTCIIAVSASDFQCAKNASEEESANEYRKEGV